MRKRLPLLVIEIFSDVICPWCFIGKRRLDQALSSGVEAAVELRWRPYQLYPQIPLEGHDRQKFLEQRYGANADRGRMPARLEQEAEQEGLKLRYDLIERMPNTLLAHRLMELAHEEDCQHALAESLFQAYFCQGRDVGDTSVLVDIAREVGMDASAAASYLQGDGGLAAVQEQLARAMDIGVSGVPGYYLANGFLLPGAQTSDTMVQIINRVQHRMPA